MGFRAGLVVVGGCEEGSQGHGCCSAVSAHDGGINGYGSGDHVCCTYKQWSSLCASLHSTAVPAAALVPCRRRLRRQVEPVPQERLVPQITSGTTRLAAWLSSRVKRLMA